MIRQNNVYGYKITSKINGNSIFLPATGEYSGGSLLRTDKYYYWSRSLYTDHPYSAYSMMVGSTSREYGQAVRAVISDTIKTSDNHSVWVDAMRKQILYECKSQTGEALEPLNYSETMRELEKSNTEEKLKRIIAELESYDQLLSDEAEKKAPTFELD